MKRDQQPERIEGDGSKYRLRHPAFGTIRVTRSSGGYGVLFGSELNHQHQVRVAITEAEMHRDYHESRTVQGRTLLELCMSESQWAQFVSSHGMHSGTPITLLSTTELDATAPSGYRLVDRPGIVPSPESHKELFDREMRDMAQQVVSKLGDAIKALQEIAESQGTISKTKVRTAISHATGILEGLPASMEFLSEQFREATDGIMQSAMTELEAIVNQVAVNTGLEALRNGATPVLSLSHKRGVE